MKEIKYYCTPMAPPSTALVFGSKVIFKVQTSEDDTMKTDNEHCEILSFMTVHNAQKIGICFNPTENLFCH